MKTINKYKGMILFSMFILTFVWFMSDTQEQKKDSYATNEMSQNLNLKK